MSFCPHCGHSLKANKTEGEIFLDELFKVKPNLDEYIYDYYTRWLKDYANDSEFSPDEVDKYNTPNDYLRVAFDTGNPIEEYFVYYFTGKALKMMDDAPRDFEDACIDYFNENLKDKFEREFYDCKEDN